MALIKEEHFGIARKIVSNMTTESWREIPHAIVMYEADVTDVLPVVKSLNANCKSREEKITLNTVMMKIICEGLKAAPSMNTHLLFNRRLVRGCLKYFDHIDVSMPMLLPDGQMMTVNMRDMGNKTLSEMTAAIVETGQGGTDGDAADRLQDRRPQGHHAPRCGEEKILFHPHHGSPDQERY